MNVSDSNQEKLQKLKALFEASASSDIYLRWYDEAFEAFSFYEGRQWTEEEKTDIRNKYGVRETVTNKIKPRIDNVSGLETRTRTKIVFRARSDKEEEQATAESLTDLAYFVQDKNDSQYILSQASRDARVCGLGFHEFDVVNNAIVERSNNPLTQVWDVTDTTPDLTEQKFIATLRWKTKDELYAQFPKKREEIDSLNVNNMGMSFKGQEQSEYFSLSKEGGYFDKRFQQYCIVEMVYREYAKYYTVQTKAGRLVSTFSKKEAEKIVAKGEEVEENDGYKVRLAYFTGDALLGDYEYKYQLNHAKGWFPTTIIPAFRENTEHLPFGLIRSAIDPQRMYNQTQTRLNWYMAANQVIADANAVDFGADTKGNSSAKAGIRAEVNRPDGVILKRSGSELRIDRHESRVQQHLARLGQLDKDIQDAMGIYDESMGVETNANSGVAISKRQAGAVQNQAMLFDKLRAAKRRWAEKLLGIIQHEFKGQQVFWITDDESKVKQVSLNKPVMDGDKAMTDEDGNTITAVDVRTGMYDIYLEEVPDNATQHAEGIERIFKAIQVVGGLEGVTEGLLDLLGVPPSHSFRKEIQKRVPEQKAADAAQVEANAKQFGGGQQGAPASLTQSPPAGAIGNAGQ